MAEPTDRPGQALTGGAQPPSPAPPPYPVRPAAAAPDARADRADGPDYRPLALAAIVGFCLAVLYAAFLVVCWLVAWLAGTPLLLSAATLLVPAVALVVSALGWLQVQRSEGTRAGGKLALWGMALSALFGLSYTAYLVASFTALRQQADTFATRWLDLIKEHKYDEAFRLTLEPGERPAEGPQLHRELELRFNSLGEASPQGELTTFTQNNLVRLINHGTTAEGGAETQISPRGVESWAYKNGGYELRLNYEIRTPTHTVVLQLALHGTERKGERQWTVLRHESGFTNRPDFTPAEFRLGDLRESASAFVDAWLKKLGSDRPEEAYLDTQEPDRRPAFRAEYGARLLAGALPDDATPTRAALLVDQESARKLYLPGYRDFRRGDLVQAPPDTFWADERLRKDIPETTRKLFERPGDLLVNSLRLNTISVPVWTRKDGRLRYYFDVTGMAFHRYTVQGWVVVETDARVLDDPAATPAWRLAALELASGRTMGSPRRPPLPGGGPPP
jgi:hypothetical protein